MTDTIVIKENPKQLIKENTVEIVKKDKRDEKLINYMIDQMMQADAKKKFEKLTSEQEELAKGSEYRKSPRVGAGALGPNYKQKAE